LQNFAFLLDLLNSGLGERTSFGMRSGVPPNLLPLVLWGIFALRPAFLLDLLNSGLGGRASFGMRSGLPPNLLPLVLWGIFALRPWPWVSRLADSDSGEWVKILAASFAAAYAGVGQLFAFLSSL
jgi:hypothetical protein